MRILLVQTSFLGDTVLSTPVIAALKRLYPESRLSVLTTPAGAELLRLDPLVSELLVFDKRSRDGGMLGLLQMAQLLRARRFERTYSLHKSYRTALLLALSHLPCRTGFEEAHWRWVYHRRVKRSGYPHDVLRNLAILSGETQLEQLSPELRLFAPPSAALRGLLPEPDRADRVVLVPGSAWATKRWVPEGFRRVAQHFSQQGREVVVTGVKSERLICDLVSHGLGAVNLCGRTSIAQLLTLIQHSSLVICNDSTALHLASAFKVPTVAVFCSTTPAFGFGPWRNRAVVLEREGLPCKPCGPHGYHACPLGTEQCMREVEASAVIEAGENLLSRKAA